MKFGIMIFNYILVMLDDPIFIVLRTDKGTGYKVFQEIFTFSETSTQYFHSSNKSLRTTFFHAGLKSFD